MRILKVFSLALALFAGGILADEQAASGLICWGALGAFESICTTTPDGVRITFNPNGTNAGLNVGAHSSAPSSLTNGDIWYDSTGNKFKCRENGSSVDCIGGGSGSISGPGSSTDNAIVRWDGTAGTSIQNSGISIDDSNVIAFPDGVKQTFNPDGTNAGLNFGSQAGDPSTLSNGDCWYNSTTNKFRCRENSATTDMIGGGGGNFTKIEETTPTGTSTTFSSLGSYTHLKIIYSARGDTSAVSVGLNMTFNSDTGANYDDQRSQFTTSSSFANDVAANAIVIGVISAATATSNYVGSAEIVFPDYRGTTFFKTAIANGTYVTAQSSGSIFNRLFIGHWRSTSAITSITITLNAGNFVSGSKFTLYGMN